MWLCRAASLCRQAMVKMRVLFKPLVRDTREGCCQLPKRRSSGAGLAGLRAAAARVVYEEEQTHDGQPATAVEMAIAEMAKEMKS